MSASKKTFDAEAFIRGACSGQAAGRRQSAASTLPPSLMAASLPCRLCSQPRTQIRSDSPSEVRNVRSRSEACGLGDRRVDSDDVWP
jgi:hypothetical protein